MRRDERTAKRTGNAGTAGTAALPARRRLVRAARRVLWEHLRERARGLGLALARSALRRRLVDFLRSCAAGRLFAILRSAALAGAVAAALLVPGSTRAQDRDLPAIELSDIARGHAGFLARGEGGQASESGSSVAGAGDVNGDGIPDLIVGGRFCPNIRCLSTPAYVVFGKADGAAVELSDVELGRGGFAIRGAATDDWLGRSVSGAGDVNGDGLQDLLVGARHASPGGRRYAGETYVVFGKADGAAVELSEVQAGRGGFAIRGAAAGDSSGGSVSGAGDVNGDGLQDLLVGASGADPGGRSGAGETYVVFGKADGAAVELADVEAGRGGFAIRGIAKDDQSGWSVSGAGDVNGDGLGDLLLGAPGADLPWGTYQAGETYVVFGKADGAAVELSEVQAGRGGFAIRGAAAFDHSGWSVSGAGDVNGDGLPDLLIGARWASPGGQVRAGETYVVFGKADGAAVELSEVQAGRGGFAIRGAAADDRSGSSVSGAGDVNGDGLGDLLLGAPGASPGGRTVAGETYVVFGKADGAAVELSEVQASRGGFAIRGAAERGSSGRSVSGAGDVNGDGLQDLLIGAPYAGPGDKSKAGETYVVFGKADGAAVELSEVQAGRGGLAIRGATDRDFSALSVSGAGDVNGDGLQDFLVGARYASPGGRSKAGETYVVFGKTDGVAVELADVQDGRGGFAILGAAPGDFSGSSVSGAGDVNGDGLGDLLIGASGADPGGRYNAGETYVVFGKPGGAAVELSEVQDGRGGFAILGAAPGDFSGWSVSGAGDVNGDGLGDLLIGASGADPGGRYNAGETYVVFGKPGGAAVELSEVQAGQGGFAIRGAAAGVFLGLRVSGAGDVNGDGLQDFLICARYASPGGRSKAGETYVVFGKADGAAVELSEVEAGQGGFAIRGAAADDRSGSSVSGVGDLDGDKLQDLLIGAPRAHPGGRYRTGETYVVFGKADRAAVELSEVKAGRGGFAIRGAAIRDYSGWSVSGAGDVNGDGLPDLLIGARDASPEGRYRAGETYVVFGKADDAAVELSEVKDGRGGFAIRGAAAGELSGSSVSGAGDVNGDGLPDALIAAGLAGSHYRNLSGAAYVVFGRGNAGAEPHFRRGAVRGEEDLDLSDGIRLFGWLFLGDEEPPCLDAADSDDSGDLDLSDAVRVLGYLFLGAEAPPDPGPLSCGQDPTDDDLRCATPTRGCPR